MISGSRSLRHFNDVLTFFQELHNNEFVALSLLLLSISPVLKLRREIMMGKLHKNWKFSKGGSLIIHKDLAIKQRV